MYSHTFSGWTNTPIQYSTSHPIVVFHQIKSLFFWSQLVSPHLPYVRESRIDDAEKRVGVRSYIPV